MSQTASNSIPNATSGRNTLGLEVPITFAVTDDAALCKTTLEGTLTLLANTDAPHFFTHRGGSKKPKPRVAALVHRRPLMDDDDREEKDEAVLYILQQSEEALKKKGPKSQAYVVKRSFAVSRLQQTTTEGTTSVAFSVDKDEVLLTFEYLVVGVFMFFSSLSLFGASARLYLRVSLRNTRF